MKLTIKGLQAEIKRLNAAKETADQVFQEFSTKMWNNIGDLTKRLQNTEASNQNLSQAFENVKAQNAKLNTVALKFAEDKERDAVTIATLTRLLDKAITVNGQLLDELNQNAAGLKK